MGWPTETVGRGRVPPGGCPEPAGGHKTRETCGSPASAGLHLGRCSAGRRTPLLHRKREIEEGASRRLRDQENLPEPPVTLEPLTAPSGTAGARTCPGGPASTGRLGSSLYALKARFSGRNAADTLSCRLFFGEPLLMENNRLIVLKRLFNK